MKIKKILVTGGAGFIGSHTVIELIKAGYEPVVLDNFSNSKYFIIGRMEKIAGRHITVYKHDCADTKSVERIFRKEGDIGGIIHFAALKAVGESVEQPLKYYRNNIVGLMTILEAAVRFGVQHIVFSSSCTVYGQPDKLPVMETTPLKEAECPYGDTKKISERVLQALVASGAEIKVASLRYFNPIGAHSSGLIGELPLGIPKNLVPFVTQTAAGVRNELVVNGDDYNTPDGTCIRDYIHVTDLAGAHVKTLEYLKKQKTNAFYDVFNLGTGRGNSVLEIIETFEKATGVKIKYRIGPRRYGDIEKIFANVDKANRVLNWHTELSLEDALKNAWEWQKRQVPGKKHIGK